MRSFANPILRISLGITFIWIGVLIFQDPSSWGYLIAPWARDLLFLPLETMMVVVSVFDIIIGTLLIVNLLTRLAASLAALHLLGIIMVSFHVPEVVARDIGLLGAALHIALLKKNN